MSNSKNNNERIIFPWNDPFEDVHICATTKVLNDYIKNDPTFKDRYLGQELKVRNEMRNNPGSGFSSIGIAVIKVYFHVLVPSSDQALISNTVLQNQITSLNADFRKTHGNTPARWSSVAADTFIEFEWDTSDINRVNSTADFSWDNAMKFSSSGGSDAYQPTKYLNVWICSVSNLLGYAQFPGGNPSTDGVVIVPASLKGSPTSQAPYNLGRTLTHEIGHWLNLLHIWGDGDCNVDDLLADTPTANGPSYGCPSITKDTCTSDSSPDMWENYMDYSYDACMNMFTQGQADRMLACLVTLRPNVYYLAAATSGTTTTTTSAPGTLTLVNNMNVAGGIIESSSQNNWSNSGVTDNLVYGNNTGASNGENGLYIFEQDSSGTLTQKYSYVSESGQFLSSSQTILNRSGTTQVYSCYRVGGSGSQKIGLFDVNPATGTATLVASSTTSLTAGWKKLSEDQYYLYLTAPGGVLVFDPATLSLVTTISTPVGAEGNFEALASWSNGSYLFVASAHQGIRVYAINSTSNTFSHTNTYGAITSTDTDAYFDISGDSNYVYTVGADLNYTSSFIEIFSIGASGTLTQAAELRDNTASAFYSCFVRGDDIFTATYGGSLANDGIKVFSFNQSTQTISEKASDTTLSSSWVVNVAGDDNYVYLSHYPKIAGGNGGIRVYSYASSIATTTTPAPGATTTTTTTIPSISSDTLCFSVDDIYCLSVTNQICDKATTGEVRVISNNGNLELEPLCDQSLLSNIQDGDTVTLCKGNCAKNGGELYVAKIDPTCSVNGDFWIKIDQSGSIINFYKKETGFWTEKDTDNPCSITTTTTTTTTTVAPTTTTTTLEPNVIRILSPEGEYSTLASVPDLSVSITGTSAGYDHWRWKLDASFPSTGVAGGNPVNSGTTATLSSLNTIGAHTINVALADSNGNMITPAVTDSIEIVVSPTIFVEGNVPNWNQLHYYEAQGDVPTGVVTSNSSKFKAWGAPAAASSQLGHLNVQHSLNQPDSNHFHGISDGVDAGSANQSSTGTETISWNATVANGGGHGWGDYLADGDIWRPTINTIPSWYSINPATIGGCTLTDFGWFMNTNNSSEDVTQPSPSGTRIGDGLIEHTSGGIGTSTHNIYKGLKDFYRTAGYDTVAGIVYHWGASGSDLSQPSNATLPAGVPEQPVGIRPEYWTDNNLDFGPLSGSYKTAGADSSIVWEIIKSEIDKNRTIIASMQGWDIQEMSSVTTHASFPNTNHAVEKASLANSGGDGIAYYKIKAEASSNTYNNEVYTLTNGSPTIPLWGATALGHAVLIIGYIPAGAADDISTNSDTDWIILRDNDEQTERNVIIPFKSATSSPTNNVDTIRWGFDCLMATIYTDLQQSTEALATCTTTTTTTTTTTSGPTTTTTSAPTTTTTTVAPASAADYCISDSTATSNDSAVNGNWWTYNGNHEGVAQYWNQGRNAINLYLWRTPVGSTGEYSWNISTAPSGGGTIWLTSSSSASTSPLVGSSGWGISVSANQCTTTTTSAPWLAYSATDCVSGAAIEFASQSPQSHWNSSNYYRVQDQNFTHCVKGDTITSSSTSMSQLTLVAWQSGFSDCNTCNGLSISIVAPEGDYNDVASVPSLTVNITGYNLSNYHWHWQLDTAFPTSGLAGGNMVTSGSTATLTGLAAGTYTIYVALVDSSHNILPYPVSDSVGINIANN